MSDAVFCYMLLGIFSVSLIHISTEIVVEIRAARRSRTCPVSNPRGESSACCPHCFEMFAINVLDPPDGYTASGECPRCGKRIRVEVTDA
jgi:uncharacterized paraquat-inducible protein A